MKPGKILGALMLFIMILPTYARAADLGELRLSLVDGDVQIKTEDTLEWVPATINMPLRDGDQIWVPGGGRSEIQARNGTAVRLDEYTSLDILTVDDESLQFYLGMGRVYLNFGSQRDSMIQLDTPDSSVRVYERAKFAVTVSGNGETDILVFRGRVYAESRSGETQVSGGKRLSLRDGYADLSPLGRADEWEEWNKDRDRKFEERGYSSQYLPTELEGYASDLDHNGRWVYTSSYGYVWTPTVHISSNWAPYSQGRWVWIGGDYVWIAYEPWGWVPYHYGRWTFMASFGWCWVPPDRGDVYWAPGYVGWVYTPTYVSWVPLAPREVYYGHGNYGRHSVNIVNVNIDTVVVKNVYKNVSVHNAVTVIHRDAFLKGKREDFKVRGNPFLTERISAGRPRIEPERATRLPIIKEVPREKEPPARVRDVRVRELKEKRRFVRERDRSAFIPEASPKTMPVKRISVPKTGDAVRPQEPESIPGKRHTQQSKTESPERTMPGKSKEIQHRPVDKWGVQPKEPSKPQPVIKQKNRQEQPVTEQKKQSRQDEGKIKQEQKELRTPGKQQEIRQTPAEKRTEQPVKPTGPQPVIKQKKRQDQRPVTEQDKQIRKEEWTTKKQPAGVKKQDSESPSSRGSGSGIPLEPIMKKETPKSLKQPRTRGEVGVQQDNVPKAWQGREGEGRK